MIVCCFKLRNALSFAFHSYNDHTYIDNKRRQQEESFSEDYANAYRDFSRAFPLANTRVNIPEEKINRGIEINKQNACRRIEFHIYTYVYVAPQ